MGLVLLNKGERSRVFGDRVMLFGSSGSRVVKWGTVVQLGGLMVISTLPVQVSSAGFPLPSPRSKGALWSTKCILMRVLTLPFLIQNANNKFWLHMGHIGSEYS